MFDTGSSIFPLGTTKANAVNIGEMQISDTLQVNSWGDKITFYGRRIEKDVRFGNRILNEALVYADENKVFKEFYDSEQIWGIVGNAFFWNHTVIIDYKNKLFVIK